MSMSIGFALHVMLIFSSLTELGFLNCDNLTNCIFFVLGSTVVHCLVGDYLILDMSIAIFLIVMIDPLLSITRNCTIALVRKLY